MKRLAQLLAIALLFMAPGGAHAQSDRVLIFAAASLKAALDEVVALDHPPTRAMIVVSYAGTPALVRQLEQGAPAGIFISADREWMDYAVKRKLVRAESMIDLLANRLVLVARKGSAPTPIEIKPGTDFAKLLGNGRLAVGQVESVPAGKYAKAALQSLGVWEQVRHRLAETENVSAALKFIALGEAPIGIVYATDPKAEPDVVVIGTLPESSHPKIVYPVALTTTASKSAEAVLMLLRSAEARRIFERHGFSAQF